MAESTIAHPAHVSCPEVAAGDPFVAAARSKARAERLAREERGIALYEERGADIQQLARGLYSVPSCTSRNDYVVHYDDEAADCECGDHQRRQMVCKHIYAVALFAARRRRVARTIAPMFVAGDEDS